VKRRFLGLFQNVEMHIMGEKSSVYKSLKASVDVNTMFSDFLHFFSRISANDFLSIIQILNDFVIRLHFGGFDTQLLYFWKEESYQHFCKL
jgi:hypothetical protein